MYLYDGENTKVFGPQEVWEQVPSGQTPQQVTDFINNNSDMDCNYEDDAVKCLYNDVASVTYNSFGQIIYIIMISLYVLEHNVKHNFLKIATIMDVIQYIMNKVVFATLALMEIIIVHIVKVHLGKNIKIDDVLSSFFVIELLFLSFFFYIKIVYLL